MLHHLMYQTLVSGFPILESGPIETADDSFVLASVGRVAEDSLSAKLHWLQVTSRIVVGCQQVDRGSIAFAGGVVLHRSMEKMAPNALPNDRWRWTATKALSTKAS